MTSTEIKAAITVTSTLIEMALPLAGLAEFEPLVPALDGLGLKLTDILDKHKALTALQAEVAAADAAANAAEAAKFPAGTP
jgi:hypothetical protein